MKFGSFLGYAVNDINKLVLNYDHLIYIHYIKNLPRITIITSDINNKDIYPVTIFEIYLVSNHQKQMIEKYIKILINSYNIKIINLSMIQLYKNDPTNIEECENYSICANTIKTILNNKDKQSNKLNKPISKLVFIITWVVVYSIFISFSFLYVLYINLHA